MEEKREVRPYILAETNWRALQDAQFELAILPWGATEAHNYHLPYGSDIIESDFMAAESARIAWQKGAKVIVLPTMPFGVNTGQADILLDLNLNPSTQMAVLGDILETLNRQGIYKLLIFNSHGGNDFKPMIRELGLKYPRMFVCVSNWYQVLDKGQYFEVPGDHADEMETSLLLYLTPHLVLPREKWGKGKERKSRIGAFREGWAWAERKWSKITQDTGVGDPSLATREKGERFFREVTQKMSEFMFDLSKTDPEKFYD